jgi:GT2 family glycosyltransferase
MNAEHRWEVHQVNLEEPLPGVETRGSAEGVYLQLWWRSLPLGHVWLPRELLPIRPNDLRLRVARAVAPAVGNYLFSSGFRSPLPTIADNPSRDRHPDLCSIAKLTSPLSALEKHLCAPPSAPARVSVLVCTRARPDSLRRCLSSLTALDPPATEIIVVDNAPQSDETRMVVGEFKSVTYCSEPATGLSRARNTGLRRATSEIVAWTDDDAIVHPSWIHAIRQVFSDFTVSGMTGLVMPAALETASQIRFERDFGGFNRGYRELNYDFQFFSEMQERGVPVWKIGAGANMAFRRNVFDLVGLFDERLGAGAAGCSEDSEIWYRILANHLKIRYEPRAVIWHSHRIDREAFRRQMEQYMRGHVASLLVQFEKFHHFGNLRRLLVSLPHHYWRLATGREHGTTRGTVWFEILGCLRGVFFYLRSAKGTRLPTRPSLRIKAIR